jgi:hypothetical protein
LHHYKNRDDKKYTAIKHHLDKNGERVWGENNNTVVTYGKKKYVSVMVEKASVLFGTEMKSVYKHISESEEVCNYVGIHPRNIELKHIAKIDIDGKKIVNSSLMNRIKKLV